MKERIQNKAQEIFIAEGFARLNMDELARDLRISKKTIYEHFSSKKELFREVVVSVNQMKFERMKTVINKMTKDNKFSIIENLPKVWEMIKDISMIYTPVFTSDIEKYAYELQDDCRYQDSMLKEHLEKAFVLGKEQGFIKDSINDEIFGIILTSSIHSILAPGVLTNLPCTLDEALRILYETLHTGILTEKGRKDYRKLILSNNSNK